MSDESEFVWEPLSGADYFILGLVGTFQVAALVVCGHLIWYRTWPPYVTKNVNLVVITVRQERGREPVCVAWDGVCTFLFLFVC